MTTPPAPPPRMAFEMHADPSLVGGVYANGLAIWHTATEFTLDFFVNAQPPQPAQTPEGETVIHAPQQLVSRVRIPPAKVFDIIRAINENLTNYEAAFGAISPREPDTPLYPPADSGDTGNGPPQ